MSNIRIITVSPAKVLALKEKVQSERPEFPVDKQKLIHAGKILKDDQSVAECGFKETDFIVCMVSKDPAPKPKPAAPTPSAAPVPTPEAVSLPTVSAPIPSPAVPAPVAQRNFENPEAIAGLTGMGFPENLCRSALNAAMGNADLAYEFLVNGIPEQRQRLAAPAAPATSAPPIDSNDPIAALRQHPQLNSLKQLVQSNPAALPQVLTLIGQQSPQLLEAIHAHNEEFLTLMNEPISATPTPLPAAPVTADPSGGEGPSASQISALLTALPPDQRAAFAQSVGMTPEQLQTFMQIMSTIPPEQLQQMMPGLGMGGGGGLGGAPPGSHVIRLTDEEMAAVTRLTQLGFTQQQAVQAYLACDKNESLAANLLFDGGFGFDDEEGAGGFEGGDYNDGGDDDMYN